MLPYLIAGAIGFAVAKLFEEDETPKYDDGGSVLLAPNGKPSNLTPEQYKLVRTLAFKQWFGDWENDPANASKVVDENGEPLIVYHGTRSDDFYEFQNKLFGYRGFYFTDKKSVAINYGSNVRQFFLNSKDFVLEDMKGGNYSDNQWIDDLVENSEMDNKDVHLLNFIDPLDPSSMDRFPISNIYIIFNKSNIKLADGTNTTFDGNNPDIRFDGGGQATNYVEFYNNLKIEDGTQYVGQKFSEVFPFLYRRKTPHDFRLRVKQYYGIVNRMAEDNYSTKAMKQTDVNKLKKLEINFDKTEYLASFYLDSNGIINKFVGSNPDIRFDGGGKLADNIFDYFIEIKGLKPLGNQLWEKSNCTIKMDFSNVLYQAQNDNRVWVSPIEYSDYKKAFSILEFHCRDKNKGVGTSVLKEIIQGADLFGYTIFIEPTSMKKYRVETDINTDDLKRWYSKYDFKPINDNYSDYVWLRSPKNPDIRFDGGGMSYREYADTQFNEEEDRYLPSDYFDDLEIKKLSKENLPLIKIKDGLEYRKWGDSFIKVFDNDYRVGFADTKAIQVAKEYQKKGIGLELVTLLKEMNPNHRFGSMTPQGFNLMGKYYDTKIANNPDIRFDDGGIISKNQILQAISDRKVIIVYDLKFTSFRNYKGEIEYRMNSLRNVDKWEIYENKKEYTKAIMQRVNYYIKRGFPQVIKIE